jgi:large subunit ribosomal protein L13
MRATSHVRSATLPERWLVVDASQYSLGRLASTVAMALMGKDTPNYTPSEMNGAFVVVINAEKVKTTGTKSDTKMYDYYTGYPGGNKNVPFARKLERDAGDIVRLAVKRMLPKSVLGRDMQRRLKIYAGADHPHAAQKPQPLTQMRK